MFALMRELKQPESTESYGKFLTKSELANIHLKNSSATMMNAFNISIKIFNYWGIDFLFYVISQQDHFFMPDNYTLFSQGLKQDG